MDRRALIRLRLAFLLLAAALLLPLGLLLRSVNARLEAQRKLRHELVAERIFDEMERELTALLQRENARPSAAYADSGTRVENWAPFVVGYFTRDARGAQIIARPQLAPERVQRLEAALEIGVESQGPRTASTSGNAPSEAQGRRPAGAAELGALHGGSEDKAVANEPQPAFRNLVQKGVSPEPVATPAITGPQRIGTAAKAVPEDVLMQLNRASEAREQERQRARPPAKRKAASSLSDSADEDPLSGY